MKVHVHLDLYKLANIGASFNEVNFTTITEKVGFYEDYQEVKRLRVRYVGGSPQIDYYNVDLLPIPTGSLIGNDVMLLSDLRPTSILSSVEFFAEYDNATNLKALITAGVITLGITGYTVIELYRLNDKRNVLSKSKTFIGYIDGQFKNPISIKNFSIDVVDYPLTTTYNYVYIPKLKRYYYVNDIAFVSKDLTRINLVEDVLSSWESLIRTQSAFVTRQENESNNLIVDKRLPLNDVISISYDNGTNTPSASSKVNTILNGNCDPTTDYTYLVVTKFFQENGPNTWTKPQLPLRPSSSMPQIASHYSNQQSCKILKQNDIYKVIWRLLQRDDLLTYLDAIIWLPFNAKYSYEIPVGLTQLEKFIRIGKYYILADGSVKDTYPVLGDPEFDLISYVPSNDTQLNQSTYLQSTAYFVIYDGTFSGRNSGTWLDYEPYTNYELWIPFVGYVKLEAKDFLNKRIIIYYIMNMRTGGATAYVYDMNNSKVIFSTGCQLGFKLDITSTNLLENTREQQNAITNTVLGLIGSVISIGAGVVTENPVAIAGGVLTASKSIASGVQANRNIYNRASTTFGDGDTDIYSDFNVKLKMSLYQKLTITDSVYLALNGKPSNQYESLSSITGYTEIGDIQFNASNYDIYNVEIDEIVALLKSGVIM